MGNAVWRDKNLIASDAANEFELERVIRKASGERNYYAQIKGVKVLSFVIAMAKSGVHILRI